MDEIQVVPCSQDRMVPKEMVPEAASIPTFQIHPPKEAEPQSDLNRILVVADVHEPPAARISTTKVLEKIILFSNRNFVSLFHKFFFC